MRDQELEKGLFMCIHKFLAKQFNAENDSTEVYTILLATLTNEIGRLIDTFSIAFFHDDIEKRDHFKKMAIESISSGLKIVLLDEVKLKEFNELNKTKDNLDNIINKILKDNKNGGSDERN